MKGKHLTVALAGNPNVGKTALFNVLTGSRQQVGNWPGKTVEKKEGKLTYKGETLSFVDLPGTYSLTAYSTEEVITRDFIIEQSPDVVVHVIDSTNIERNLYLTTQLMELNAPLILALNMSDLAEAKGIEIDESALSKFLGVPVVKIVAPKRIGVEGLLEKILQLSRKKVAKPMRQVIYGEELEEHISGLQEFVKKTVKLPKKYEPRWIALKLLEDDKEVDRKIRALQGGDKVLEEAETETSHLKKVFGGEVDQVVAEARYGFIAGLVKECVKKTPLSKRVLSDLLDEITMHDLIGIPIFLGMMFLLFQFTFVLGEPLAGLIDAFFSWVSGQTAVALGAIAAPDWLASLVVDGIIAGVGSVIVFIPYIFLLFFILSLMQDSGYMARAAFIMDNVMHKIGLHGKSFIPMIVGFGCNVPAVMATRTLETKKDRLLTILLIPFMSCAARLPVYVLFVGAFFPHHRGLVLFSLYLLGIVLAILAGLVFKRLFFKGLSTPFVMELPPYRMPTLSGALIHMWERGKIFIKNAGTIIFVMVVAIWFLSNLPFGVEYASQESVIGAVGTAIAPVFAPLGFGTWQAAVSLLFGVAAKEVVIGTFGTVYGVGEAGLTIVLQNSFTPLSAYAFLVFVLLYVPCMATLAVMRRETKSWRWPLFVAAYTTGVAWVMAFLVYQGGLLLGFS